MQSSTPSPSAGRNCGPPTGVVSSITCGFHPRAFLARAAPRPARPGFARSLAGTARVYTSGDVPVPGFRLVKRLGRGGFGEVWKATGPGGTEAAIKIINLG